MIVFSSFDCCYVFCECYVFSFWIVFKFVVDFLEEAFHYLYLKYFGSVSKDFFDGIGELFNPVGDVLPVHFEEFF